MKNGGWAPQPALMSSPEGTAETSGNESAVPNGTGHLSPTQPRTAVLGYFQVAPSGLDLRVELPSFPFAVTVQMTSPRTKGSAGHAFVLDPQSVLRVD
jgi:hypothetical protein